MLPPEKAIIMAENLRPRPVSPTTPTMIPATAQAIETATALRAPSSSASSVRDRPRRQRAMKPASVGPSAQKVQSARAAAAATTATMA